MKLGSLFDGSGGFPCPLQESSGHPALALLGEQRGQGRQRPRVIRVQAQRRRCCHLLSLSVRVSLVPPVLIIHGKAVFKLETPSAELSETPDSVQKPYATYSVVIDAEGFLRHINLGIPVFAGINSVQDVVLTSPSAANGADEIVVPDESDYDL